MLSAVCNPYDYFIGSVPLLHPFRVYSSVGRMFALSTVPEIREELQNKEKKCKSLVTQMDEKKVFLLKSLKEQEDNLRELVQSRQGVA